MTSLAPTQPLTPSEQRIAQHVIAGLDAREIAAATRLTQNTVRSMLRAVRWKLVCPERCSLTVVAHRLLGSGQITAPTPPQPAPDLTPGQIRLLTAAAEHTLPRDIALAADLAPADLREALDQLLADTGTQDPTELVVRAHGWQLLPAEQAGHPTRSGAPQ